MGPTIVVQVLPFSQDAMLRRARRRRLRGDFLLEDLMHLLVSVVVHPPLTTDVLDADTEAMPPQAEASQAMRP